MYVWYLTSVVDAIAARYQVLLLPITLIFRSPHFKMPQCWDARGLEYTICRDFKDNDESDFVLLSRGTFRWAYPCLKAQVADVRYVLSASSRRAMKLIK